MDLKTYLIERVELNRDSAKELGIKNMKDLENLKDVNMQRRIHYMLHPEYDFMDQFKKFMKKRGLNEHVADIVYMFFDKYQTDGGVNVLMDYIFNIDDRMKLSVFDIFTEIDKHHGHGNIINIITKLINNKIQNLKGSIIRNTTKEKYKGLGDRLRDRLNQFKEIEDQYKDLRDIDKNVVIKLAAEKNAGGIKVGDFEFLLRVLLGDEIDINDHRGDICGYSPVYGKDFRVEIKAGTGRIAAAKTSGPDIIRKTLNEMLKDRLNNIEIKNTDFNGKGGKQVAYIFFKNLYNILIGKESISIYVGGNESVEKYMEISEAQQFISELIVRSYMSQWPQDKVLKIKDDLVNFIQKTLFRGDKLSDEDNKKDILRKCIATISLCCYCLTEDFTHFLVLNNKFDSGRGGQFYYIDFSGVSGNTEIIERAWEAFDKDYIKINQIQTESDKVYGKGIQIEIGDIDIDLGSKLS